MEKEVGLCSTVQYVEGNGNWHTASGVHGLSVLTVAAAAVAAVVAAVEGSTTHSTSIHHPLHHYSSRLHHFNHSHHCQQPQQHQRLGVNHLRTVGGNTGVYSSVVTTELMVTVDGEQHCLVQEGSKRWRCKRCNLRGHEKRTRLRCQQCCVALCASCFQYYHQEKDEHRSLSFASPCGGALPYSTHLQH